VLPTGILSTNSGTSFACPITAGAFACLREAFPNVANTAIINAVRQSGTLHSNPNDDYGYGIPDFGMAYEYLAALYPTDTTASPTALVYPNPFTTSLNIVIPGLLTSPMNYDIYDLLGQRVCSGSFAAGTYANNLLSITPPPSLSVGSYVLRINGSTCIRLVKRF